MNRISIRNNTFNTGSDEFEAELEIIIVNEFDPNAVQAPVCWSSDTRQPDSQVFEKQAVRCMDCKHDIRGSASGGGRACKYSQKLAVLLKDDPNVYQLHIPASSIFGRAKDGHMPLQEYARFLLP